MGWNEAGEAVLVAVDGRQPGHSLGLSLPAAADLLVGLGATEGINLDGGGSTTLALGGDVANAPSDRLVLDGGRERIVTGPAPAAVTVGTVERPVASALAVVPEAPPAPPSEPPPLSERLGLPRELPLPPPVAADPASRIDGGSPALVAVTPPPAAPDASLVVVALLANALAAGALGGYLLRSRLD